MSTEACRAILESRLSNWASAKPIRVEYQNVPLVPANGETYLRSYVIPADTESLDLAGDHRGYRGVFQVSIVRPINGGTGAALNIAAELDALFPKASQYTSGAVTVQITTPANVGPGIQEEHNYVIPVSIGYRADTL